jgi:uncharacterized protein with HEPN domain
MRNEQLYLTDILEAADSISLFLAGLSEEDQSRETPPTVTLND